MLTTRKIRYIFFVPVFLVILSIPMDRYIRAAEAAESENEKIFRPVMEKMLAKGADTSFVYDLVNHENTKFIDRFVKISVSISGKKRKGDYSGHYSRRSVKRAEDFMKKYYYPLKKSEARYGVPVEVISAVLWIETRCGSYLGNNHVVSVFLSTALADQPKFVLASKVAMKKKSRGKKQELKRIYEDVDKRARKKADWALGELLALEKVQEMKHHRIHSLKGSWAGAFGISQFLPSSYVRWAVDGNKDGVINLFHFEDAIHSVGNYLKINGWGNTDKEQRAAVYHYNHSTAYVDAVLKLAKKLGKKEKPTLQFSITTPLRKQVKMTEKGPDA